ncbi:amino acid ABC transporter permease [Salinicola sp. CPA57]|uniref:amino acid ABC transporter permease n=1 Tax=Salinicola sp. CPA57 TaxID=1949080 RepID=UPI000DA11CF2|nr:amino acid ABC transporter permease [Salinicola sp. CPA57]
MFDLALLVQGLPLLLAGLWNTVWLSACGLALGFLIGIGVCSLKLSERGALRRLGGAYISVFRGIPLLIQLLFIYYLLPRLGLDVPAWVAAIAGLALCSGAYLAEILRGGLLTLPAGQVEAARLLGLSGRTTLTRIKLPQALRATLPALLNEVILLIKASSLISAVGLAELTRTAQNLAASSFLQLQFYLAAAALYCVVNISLALLAGRLERRFAKGRA